MAFLGFVAIILMYGRIAFPMLRNLLGLGKMFQTAAGNVTKTPVYVRTAPVGFPVTMIEATKNVNNNFPIGRPGSINPEIGSIPTRSQLADLVQVATEIVLISSPTVTPGIVYLDPTATVGVVVPNGSNVGVPGGSEGYSTGGSAPPPKVQVIIPKKIYRFNLERFTENCLSVPGRVVENQDGIWVCHFPADYVNYTPTPTILTPTATLTATVVLTPTENIILTPTAEILLVVTTWAFLPYVYR